jgi:hypothetical protein
MPYRARTRRPALPWAVSIDGAAAALDVSRAEIQNMIEDGLPVYIAGGVGHPHRIFLADLLEFAQARWPRAVINKRKSP